MGALMRSGLDPCTPIGHQQANGTWSEYDCTQTAGIPMFIWVGLVLAVCVILACALWFMWPRAPRYLIPGIDDPERLR